MSRATDAPPRPSADAPRIHWFRRDLRLADNPALTAAADGGPVLPVFVLDPETEALGAAARWRLELGLEALAGRLEAAGSRLILRRGEAAEVLLALARETGAGAVHWGRLHRPTWRERDAAVAAALRKAGLAAEDHPGHLLHEPGTVTTREGGPFRVFTPFWNAIGPRDPGPSLPAPRLAAPADWPGSDTLADWRLGAAMDRGGAVVRDHAHPGEAAARRRLTEFLEFRLAAYPRDRDRPDRPGGSGLSENLTWGEISPREVWTIGRDHGGPGSDAFLRELAWREFAWHLLHHTPEIERRAWRPDWDGFPWRRDNPDAERWRRGMTGEPLVDAGMRELFVTGTMHNRVRMVVASYLTKHLLTHWRVGLAWFEDCLIDWDPASNALNWQWVAGSGPDAAPFFRIFNPETQADRYDPDGAYRRRWLRGYDGAAPGPKADAFFAAAPRSWNLDPDAPLPKPVISLGVGRQRALGAYEHHRHSHAGSGSGG